MSSVSKMEEEIFEGGMSVTRVQVVSYETDAAFGGPYWPTRFVTDRSISLAAINIRPQASS